VVFLRLLSEGEMLLYIRFGDIARIVDYHCSKLLFIISFFYFFFLTMIHDYDAKIKTVMANNSTNMDKTENLSQQII
jgi:hypothetical protein